MLFGLFRWAGLALLLGLVYLGATMMKPEILGETSLPHCQLRALNQMPDYRCEQFKGARYLMVHFWSTTCPSCVIELPKILKLTDELKQKGGEVLFISLLDSEETALAFLKAKKIDSRAYHFALDDERSVSARFGTEKIPETYLYARNGQLIKKFIGAQDWSFDFIKGYLPSL